jgi:hypothetical protein
MADSTAISVVSVVLRNANGLYCGACQFAAAAAASCQFPWCDLVIHVCYAVQAVCKGSFSAGYFSGCSSQATYALHVNTYAFDKQMKKNPD